VGKDLYDTRPVAPAVLFACAQSFLSLRRRSWSCT